MRSDLCKYQLKRISPCGRHAIVYHRDEGKSFRYTFGPAIDCYVAADPMSEWAHWPQIEFGAETIDAIRAFKGSWWR